jgi:5-methylcytosine-specific restriction endonuclease McrA
MKLAEETPNCKYCNNALDYITPYGDRKNIDRANAPTVDSINNENILTIHNIEILCWRCNTTKLDRTKKDFYEYCKNFYLKFKGDYDD